MKMKRNSYCCIISVGVVFLWTFPFGAGIKCHSCNSHMNEQCDTLAGNATRYLVDCDDKVAENWKDVNYTLCRKIVMTFTDEKRIVRSCGWEKHHYDCYTTTSPIVKSYICQCFEDGCNTAPGVISEKVFLPVVVLLFSLYLLQ
ncbi:uncharacterized protein LOC143237469 [Tachypleus tridentatus]|uniref:uncharacterized protein LOC143237469 n=1 Tax=Tachypleus tridentatus TaxID=6853 RepID=UPI003FD27D9D